MSRKHLLGLVCLTITVIVGAAFYQIGNIPKQIVVDSSDSAIPLATSTIEENITIQTESATSSKIIETSLYQPGIEAVNQATSTKSMASVVPPHPMEDLILRPDEVPYDYRPMGTMGGTMITNPGFMTGELRSNFMLKGISPNAVKQVYGGLYKNYENHYDLFVIAYEYDSLAKLQTDLPRINTGLREEGMNDRATVTVYKNYLIVVMDDDGSASLEFIMLLTDKLRSKLPGYKSSDLETSLTPAGKSIEKLSRPYTIKDLILQPDEVPETYTLQESLFDENIANPGFVPDDSQNELLLEIGAPTTSVRSVYGVQYQNAISGDDLFTLVLEYEMPSAVQAAQKSISASIIEQEMEGYVTVTPFENYIIYLYADDSVELTTLLTDALRTKLPIN